MKIHANAPLGPKGRATMVRRILEEGIALTESVLEKEALDESERALVRSHTAEGAGRAAPQCRQPVRPARSRGPRPGPGRRGGAGRDVCLSVYSWVYFSASSTAR
jgi:hypothetical protein